MEDLNNKITELNNKIDSLDNRIKVLENINKKNKIKKIVYYSLLGVGSIIIIVITYIIFKNTYGQIINYFN